MDCQHFKRKFIEYSKEKITIAQIITSNKYLCPMCHQIHDIREEQTNEELS